MSYSYVTIIVLKLGDQNLRSGDQIFPLVAGRLLNEKVNFEPYTQCNLCYRIILVTSCYMSLFFVPFDSILSPLLAEYDSNIKASQEQVFFLKVL